jgi:hypothetical protein
MIQLLHVGLRHILKQGRILFVEQICLLPPLAVSGNVLMHEVNPTRAIMLPPAATITHTPHIPVHYPQPYNGIFFSHYVIFCSCNYPINGLQSV